MRKYVVSAVMALSLAIMLAGTVSTVSAHTRYPEQHMSYALPRIQQTSPCGGPWYGWTDDAYYEAGNIKIDVTQQWAANPDNSYCGWVRTVLYGISTDVIWPNVGVEQIHSTLTEMYDYNGNYVIHYSFLDQGGPVYHSDYWTETDGSIFQLACGTKFRTFDQVVEDDASVPENGNGPFGEGGDSDVVQGYGGVHIICVN